MKFRKEFIGLDGFLWWFGVVEDRQDPLGLGRCRVRIFGVHSESLSDIPTEDLPWAHPSQAVNNHTFSTPKEGEYVFGFFVDGKFAQQPIILGIIPGFVTNQGNPSFGFNDTRSHEVIQKAPKKPVSLVYNTDGSGIEIGEANTANTEVLETLRYPNEDQFGKQTITGVSRYDNLEKTAITARRDNRDINIVSADSQIWDEPYTAYNPVYPYNQVLETESGHIFELDDTPENERVALSHRSGTFFEIYPSGTKVEKITKQNFKIVMSDDHIHIMGKALITVDSDCYIRVLGDAKIEAGNDLDIKVSGNMNLNVKEALNIKASSVNLEVLEDFNTLVSGSTKLKSSSVNIEAVENLSAIALGDISLDATILNFNNGVSQPTNLEDNLTGLGDLDERASKNEGVPPPEGAPAGGPTVFEVIAVDDDIEKTLENYNTILLDNGLPPVSDIPPTEGESTVPPAGGDNKDIRCGSIVLLDDYKKVRVSKSFTLADFTQNGTRKLIDQNGFTQAEILCHIIKLAENILEPIVAAGIRISISSGFRTPEVKVSGGGTNKKSEHLIGRAVDFNVIGMSAYEGALKIYPIVGKISRQFFLEYDFSSRGGAGWLHISYKDGEKHPTNPMATWSVPKIYARNKFVDLKPGQRFA